MSGKKFIPTQKDLQNILSLCRKLSLRFTKIFPDISPDEFFSVSLVAVGEGLKTYNSEKGDLKYWISLYVCSRFIDFLRKEKKKKLLKEKLYRHLKNK